MASVYKILGQVLPSSGSLTTLYTAPSQVVVSTLSVCNQSTSTTYRVAVQQSGSAVEPKHYIVYDAALNANDSIFLSLGMTLSGSDVVSVYSGNSSSSFHLYGTEIS